MPSWAGAALAAGAPVLAAVALQPLLGMRSFWDAHEAAAGALTAVLAASLAQASLKWAVGGLRPHFYDRCRPDPAVAVAAAAAAAGGTGTGTGGGGTTGAGSGSGSGTGTGTGTAAGTGVGYGGILYTTDICTSGASAAEIRDAVSSFPSGHAAAVSAGMLFLALWLNAKLKVLGGGVGRRRRRSTTAAWGLAVCLLLPALATCLVCASLVADHSHHGRDLVAGAAIGVLCALAAYRARYAALLDPRYNHIPLNRLRAYRYDDDDDDDDDEEEEEEEEEREGEGEDGEGGNWARMAWRPQVARRNGAERDQNVAS